jgi:uncharacterized DUF497 family protein
LHRRRVQRYKATTHGDFSPPQERRLSCIAYTIKSAVFDWDKNNLRKILAHRIKPEEVEQGLSNCPILIYEQDVQGEIRYIYYGEADSGRLLAIIVVERAEKIRVVTAYDLDAGQKRDYLTRRVSGE